jgi:zinc/manganese transport system permease protein
VIFVDLSLAQIAALGAAIAILMPFTGGDPHAPSVYWVSLGFTFIGAAVFSTIRGQRARIPQEAVIGICYAVASAAAILAMSKATSESEHLKDMLVGNILAVSWPEVFKTAALYGVIGLFHYRFRKTFLAISLNHDSAVSQGISVRFWDFLFYASFGFVVTSSVAIAGVLLVFCYLIVPSVGRCSMPTAWVSVSPSAGRWGRWCRRWESTYHWCSICRRAPRSSSPSAWFWR